VADALGRAGGKLPAADVDRLNLAARLVDGQKILVTRRGDPLLFEAAGPGGSAGMAGGDAAHPAPAEPVDLNTADIAALESLPGIGPAMARAILEERDRRGGFRSTRDLLRVQGIGEGRFARLKDRVRV
jgi:competence protein ComEA